MGPTFSRLQLLRYFLHFIMYIMFQKCIALYIKLAYDGNSSTYNRMNLIKLL